LDLQDLEEIPVVEQLVEIVRLLLEQILSLERVVEERNQVVDLLEDPVLEVVMVVPEDQAHNQHNQLLMD
jgi:hypothetical protein